MKIFLHIRNHTDIIYDKCGQYCDIASLSAFISSLNSSVAYIIF